MRSGLSLIRKRYTISKTTKPIIFYPRHTTFTCSIQCLSCQWLQNMLVMFSQCYVFMIHQHLTIYLTVTCVNTLFVAGLTRFFVSFRSRNSSETFWARCSTSLQSRKVSEASLGRAGRNESAATRHEQYIITSNCQLYCQFSLVNLCGREYPYPM